jgi:hypothetical protein
MEPARKKMIHEQRMCQHEHNGHISRVRMAMRMMVSISQSQTVTNDVTIQSSKAFTEIEKLLDMLKFRVNADGTISEVGKGKHGKQNSAD